MNFFTHLWNLKLAPSTIRTYLSAIGYFHKINSLPDHTTHFAIQKALKGAVRLSPLQQMRQPISLTLLRSMINSLGVLYDSNTATLYKAMFATAFYALCRISEITADNNTTHTLQQTDAVRLSSPLGYRITFRTFKHSNSPQSVLVQQQTPTQYCPVYLLDQYLKTRPATTGHLFTKADNAPVRRSEFTVVLKNVLQSLGMGSTNIKSHSFRIGGATYAAELGLTPSTVQALGRWHSDSFKAYIRWH